jgi:hypothetical protein
MNSLSNFVTVESNQKSFLLTCEGKPDNNIKVSWIPVLVILILVSKKQSMNA